MTRERGAVYQAAGARYIDQAATAARSLRATNPGLGTALFCDDPAYARSHFGADFDEVIGFSDDSWLDDYVDHLRRRDQLVGLKVPVACRLPFEISLLIDSDTLAIGDLTPAFDLMGTYDVLACEDADHLIDTDTRSWNAVGLIDLHQRSYFNAGVVYLRHGAGTQRFAEAWADVYRNSSDAFARSNDQNALNYLLNRPSTYMSDLSFSTSALRCERYNAACRFWIELWEAGLWSEVRLLHTWMSEGLHRRMEARDLDWEQFFYREAGEAAEYVRRYSIGRGLIDREVKRRCYEAIADRPFGLKHYVNAFLKHGEGIGGFAGLSDLYLVDEATRHAVREALAITSAAARPQPVRVLQIGLRHCYAGMSGFVDDARWRTGFDLEFLAAAFGSHEVVGITRYPFLRYGSARVVTTVQDYGRAELDLPEGCSYDVVVDADGGVRDTQRLRNAEIALAHLASGGALVMIELSAGLADELCCRFADCVMVRRSPARASSAGSSCVFVKA